MQRLLEERVIERFLKCGDPHHGFARVYCPECRHDYLLALPTTRSCPWTNWQLRSSTSNRVPSSLRVDEAAGLAPQGLAGAHFDAERLLLGRREDLLLADVGRKFLAPQFKRAQHA